MAAWLVVLAAPVFRVATWYLLPEYRPIIGKAFPTIADAIAAGCVLAIIRDHLAAWRAYAWLLGSRWFVIVPSALILANYLASYNRPDYVIGQTIRNIAIAVCLDWCVR
jgi:hypothetical protein